MKEYTIPLKGRLTPSEGHHLAMALMCNCSDEKRDFTFRILDDSLVIHSDRDVDIPCQHTVQELLPLEVGKGYFFHILFSPFRGHNSNIPIVRDVEITDWLVRAGERNGLAFTRTVIRDKKHIAFPHGNRTIHVNSVDAVLYGHVVDDRANDFVKQGVGKHRAFGYGLVQAKES